MSKKILIVDDEIELLSIAKEYLKKENYKIYTSYNGEEALLMFESINPDFVILDLMLPDISGEEICKKIRENSQVPILMLTAKSDEEDRINGLSLGADDYLTKPFSMRELVLRVQNIFRRIDMTNDRKILIFGRGDLVIDIDQCQVKKDNEIIKITPNEWSILSTLAQNPKKTFSREQLMNNSFGYNYVGFDRTIDTHIKNIRQKIEEDSKKPKYIVTVYGIGYKFMGE